MKSLMISCVMPTYNRARYIPTAIRCFLQQTYQNKELIIVDDGNEKLSLTIGNPQIAYIELNQRTSTGTKRNIGAENARGEIIVSWDDDDWSSAHRLEDQIQRLLKTQKAVTGYNATIVYDEVTGGLYKNCGGPPYFASGTSQCYMKSWWDLHPFPDCSYGEDSVFARTARLADELSVADPGKMLIARKHATNTDYVNLNRLQKLPAGYAPAEFYHAMQTFAPVSSYIEEGHKCNPICVADIQRQAEASIVDADYKVKWLPEIVTR